MRLVVSLMGCIVMHSCIVGQRILASRVVHSRAMDSRTFFKSLLARERLNPTSLSKRMHALGYEPVHQSVMSRYLRGSDLTTENARRIAAALGCEMAALVDDQAAADEAIRIGLVKSDLTEYETLSDYPASTVRAYSAKKQNLAPVFEWARLGEVLFTESSSLTAGEYREKTDAAGPLFKWFIAEIDMPRLRIKRGWRVAINPIVDDSGCQEGDTYLFRTSAGAFFLGDFRRLAAGYEAIPDSGPPLDTNRHGIVVVGQFHGAMK